MLRTATWLGAGALLLAASAAQAGVVHDNGVGVDNGDSGWYSSVLRDWRVFDDFTLAGTATIEHVWFQQGTTNYNANQLQSFTFSVFADASGAPGGLLHTQTLAPGGYTATQNGLSSFPNGPFFDIEFDVTPLTLGAGRYWVSFLGIGSTDFRTPNTGTGNGFLQERVIGTGELYARDGNTPFRLDGVPAVPLPPAALMGLGLLGGLGVLRRLRKQR